MSEEELESFYQKGGTYIIPVEVMNDFYEDYKELEAYKSNMDYEYLKLQRELEKLKEELESVNKWN